MIKITRTTDPHLGEIIQVGGDTLAEYDLEHLISTIPSDRTIEILFYHYVVGDYSGAGVATYRDSKGEWHIDNLGHCSCYGPFDGGFNKIGYTKEQVLGLLRSDDYNYDWEENKPGGNLLAAAMLERPSGEERPHYYKRYRGEAFDPNKKYDFLISCFAYGYCELDNLDLFEVKNCSHTKDGLWVSEYGVMGNYQQIEFYRESK